MGPCGLRRQCRCFGSYRFDLRSQSRNGRLSGIRQTSRCCPRLTSMGHEILGRVQTSTISASSNDKRAKRNFQICAGRCAGAAVLQDHRVRHGFPRPQNSAQSSRRARRKQIALRSYSSERPQCVDMKPNCPTTNVARFPNGSNRSFVLIDPKMQCGGAE